MMQQRVYEKMPLRRKGFSGMKGDEIVSYNQRGSPIL